MTGTTVKDVNSAFANLASGAVKGAKGVAAGDSFQTIWNNRMGRNTESGTAKTQSVEKSEKSGSDFESFESAKPGDSLKVKDEQRMRTEEPENALKESVKPEEPAEPETLNQEQLEEAMEVLGTAAMELMQQIADTFGISVEELQGAMEELEMDPLELLQPEELGKLLLNLGGAEDSRALVMDEALYDSYKMLMEQMNATVEEAAGKLDVEPQQIGALLEQVSVPEEEKAVSVEEVSEKPETVKQYEGFESSRSVVENLPEENKPQTEDGLQNDSGQKSGGETDKDQRGQNVQTGHGENPFVQDLRTLQPQQELQQAQDTVQSSPWTTDTQDIMRQIMDYMKIQLNADTTNLEMQLHPESLGTLQVQVQSKAGVVTANFVTQNEAVKAALESQMVQLKESFEEQGVKVEAIEVTVQPHAFERNLNQGRGQNQSDREPARRARVRRINLNDPLTMEAMEEEDTLAADLMAASGNTVDYTA